MAVEEGAKQVAVSDPPPSDLEKPLAVSEPPTDLDKSLAASEPPTELEKSLIRQIEFYFGDRNLSKDKFLQEKIKEDSGWISLAVLTTFNRLKQLSTDFEVITNALAKSSNKIVQVSEDKKKIRREPSNPLPEKNPASRKDEEERSVYVKGFPLDSKIDKLLLFFEPYDTEHIYMRRLNNDKHPFKGSVFALFKTKEKADEFMAVENLKYDNKDLLKESRVDYGLRKGKQREEIMKQREERKQKKKNDQGSSADKDKDDGEKKDEDGFDSESIEKGCLLKLTGLGDKTCWEDIKKVFSPHADVAFVDYSRGLTEATVRFQNSDGTKHALEQVKTADDDGNKLTICDKEVEATILDGEEEIGFWKKYHMMKVNRNNRNHSRNGRGRGRGNGRGRGRSSFRGGRHDRDSNYRDDRKRKNEDKGESYAKEKKTETVSDVKTENGNKTKSEPETKMDTSI